ncbi:MAG: hypothetical protein OXC60_21065 [Litoreibacter sp.]|nr:hypothetical protein [Litoreibacter sp.]
MEYKPRQPTGRAEDYTTPFLWAAGLVLFIGLCVLWFAHSFLAALVSAGFLRAGIARIPRRD